MAKFKAFALAREPIDRHTEMSNLSLIAWHTQEGFSMGKSMLAPHASVAGFAIFLVVYATQIWGGVFPFLPTDFQTQEVTLTFYLSQSLAFCASYVASAFGSYYVPPQHGECSSLSPSHSLS